MSFILTSIKKKFTLPIQNNFIIKMSEKFYYKKDRLNQIRGFCSVIKFGSVHEAARNLNIEASTVSKQVLTLERDIGLELFNRSNKRKLVLNEHGNQFYNKAIKILQNVEGLFDHFKQDIEADNVKEIKIAATHTAICYLLPQYIKIFKEQYDNIKFTIFNIPFLESTKKLLDEEVDLVIWTANSLSPEFTCKDLYDFKSNIIMHKNNSLSQKKDNDITYEDLQKENILMMDKYNYMNLFSQIIKTYNLTGNIKFINGDWESIKCFVKLNLGIHFYSEIYTKFNNFKDDDIIYKNVEHLFPNSQYKIITKTGRIFNENIEKFLKIIEEVKI